MRDRKIKTAGTLFYFSVPHFPFGLAISHQFPINVGGNCLSTFGRDGALANFHIVAKIVRVTFSIFW